MPADDTLLGQNLVEVRNEERRSVFAIKLEEGAPIGALTPRRVRDPEPLTFCTQDAQCGAEADQHLEGCPVEARLKETFGF